MIEYMPKIARWKLPFLFVRGQIYTRITKRLNYFLIRHEFNLEQRKHCDMYFISHYHISHPDDTNTTFMERFRFNRYWRLYAPEIHEVTDAIKGKKFDDVPAEVEDYVKKWQPLAQPPAFVVELIHGMDGSRMTDYSDIHIPDEK